MPVTITTTETGLVIFSEEGSANALLTSTIPALAAEARDRRDFRIVQLLVAYTAAVSLSVLVDFDAGLGAGFDTRLQTAVLVAERYVLWLPDGEGFFLGSDDALVVTAPAGGAGVIARVMVYAR